MFSFKMVLFTTTLSLIVLLSIVSESEARTVGALGLESTPSWGSDKGKRNMFDPNCKGIYDRQIFSELEQVCQDCYNLYRKPHVATECRRECYNTEVFESCLRDLMLHDFMDDYKGMAQMVAGRK